MLVERLTEDLKTAMKARDSLRVETLRFTLADLKNARIEKGEDLTDEDAVTVLRRAVKRREESIEQYRQGNREDLADKEAKEAEILRAYLPAMLEGDALAAAVDAAIAETGAASPKEMGKVMQAVMSAHAGKVDGKQVQALVRERLGG